MAAAIVLAGVSGYRHEEPEQKSHINITTSDSEISQDEPTPHLHAKTYLAVLAVCSIYFVQIYTLVGTGALTPALTASLTPSHPHNAIWFTSTLSISTALLSPILSQLSDYTGRRPILLASTLLGALGSLIIARSKTFPVSMAGFAVTSLSYGAQPLLHAVSGEVLPRRWRSWGQAADLVASGLGGLGGLLVAGWLGKDDGREGVKKFWIVGCVLYVIATGLCSQLYVPGRRTEREEGLSVREKMGRLDWAGYGLLTGGVVLFCVGLSWSRNPFGWEDGRVSGTFAAGVAMMGGLGVYEGWWKRDGMFHHGLFGNRNFGIALVCLFCEGLAFFGANNYFAFQVGVLYEPDAFLVSVRYSITMIVSIFSAMAAGWYCVVYRRVRWITVVSFLVFVLFFALMATTDEGSSREVWGYPVLLGTALGLSLVSLISVAQLSTPPELIATASGLVIGIRSLGGTVGLAIYNALFNNVMDHVGEKIAAAVIPLGLPPNSTEPFIGALMAHDNAAMFQVPGVTPEIVVAGVQQLLSTFTRGFQHVWIAASAFVGFAAVLAVFIQDPRKEFNIRIDNPVEKDEDLYSDGS